ncbi:MAG: S9 family peptidase [Bacteroidales bacterium]|nr:S9 family peptidase [Bacteroidales bacterium]
MKSHVFIPLAVCILAACTPTVQNDHHDNGESPVIGKKEMKLESDLMTPEVLWSFGRISDFDVSPDQSRILFGVTYYDIPQNKGNCDLYTIAADGADFSRITYTGTSEYNALWRPDGQKIGFLFAGQGGMQVWEANPDGSDRKQISDFELDINGFKYSPDMKRIAFIAEVKSDTTARDIYPDLDKANGKVINDLMYRHWDTWVESVSHIFIADYDGQSLSNVKDIMAGESYDSPLKPFGGMEEINWSPDGRWLAYTCQKMSGKDYAHSTNSDIYLYDLSDGSTDHISQGMMGYDKAPVFSPDGKKIAWESMEREGYESDKNRLIVMEIDNGNRQDLTATFDQDVHGLAWDETGETIYFTSGWHGTVEIYAASTTSGIIRKITSGIHNYLGLQPSGSKIIATRQSMSMPTEIFSVNIENGEAVQLTRVNEDILSQLTMGNVEKRWILTTDNKEMLTWIIYPPHFDPAQKYPALLYCQGGPQSMVGQFWSYRWNFQMMAANGYIVVAPNRRGVPGFGSEWNEQISGDYGGQNMKDCLSAIDEMKKEPFIDENSLGAVGASYGGFSVYWLAGNHQKRFKAFIAHDGMFNLESQYLETEEMWFVNWDLGGPFWETENQTAMRSYANSPHRFVKNWDTPILIIHSEKDYRITYTQGMSAFNAAVILGIPAEFLYFPDENHWVLKPQNGILWQRRFFNWLDQWLK